VRLTIAATANEAAEAAARFLGAQIAEAVANRGRCTLALSGGRTPWSALERLVLLNPPWQALEVFQVDERVVGDQDARRNAGRLRSILIGNTRLASAHFHAMPVDPPLDSAARRYQAELADLAGAPPVLDVVQLGLGVDGHTASLVPGDPLCEVTDQEVGVSGLYDGTLRLSLTFPAINRARAVLWLVTGAEKRPSLARLLAEDRSIPAARVSRARATLIADRAAAPG
jgi:6-phosphogluconolactonase